MYVGTLVNFVYDSDTGTEAQNPLRSQITRIIRECDMLYVRVTQCHVNELTVTLVFQRG